LSNLIQARRGGTTARLAITPQNGELIWDTDQKKLYVGDGVTAGGVAVTSSGASGNISGAYDIEATTTYTDLGLSDEFESSGINSNWTLGGGASPGSVSLLTDTSAIYDRTTRDKGLLIQLKGDATETFTMRGAGIASGEQIVFSISVPQQNSGDSAPAYFRVGMSTGSASYNDGTAVTATYRSNRTTAAIDGLWANMTVPLASTRLYVRMIRSGSAVWITVSQDGTTWTVVGNASDTSMAYTWLVFGSTAQIGAHVCRPIFCVNWIRHVAYTGYDPW